MKGLELPVNTLVILVIALIILIALVAMFMGVWGQSSSGIAIDAAKNSGCQRYIGLGYCDEIGHEGADISIDHVKCILEGNEDDLKNLAADCFDGKTAYELCCPN